MESATREHDDREREPSEVPAEQPDDSCLERGPRDPLRRVPRPPDPRRAHGRDERERRPVPTAERQPG